MVFRSCGIFYHNWRRCHWHAEYVFIDSIFSLIDSVQPDFPRVPSGVMKRHITDEADMRLAFYLPLPPDEVPPPGIEIPPRPQLPDTVVDAPLVRLFNFLRTYPLF